jgi:lipopolysaccharide biosynthesis protein
LSGPIARLVADSALPRIEVCLLIHLFYADLWPELAVFAGNFDVVSRDVFVNVVDEAWTPQLQREIRETAPGAFVQLSNDNGRDIGGFLRLLDNVEIGKYEIFTLMHSKKSPHIAPEKGVHWRRELLSTIAGSRETVEECIGLFRTDPTVGLIGCGAYRETNLGNNEERWRALLDRFDIDEEHRESEYLSGTMFMIRSEIIARLYDTLKETEFEYGGDKDVEYHRDGQIAHGVERVIGNLVRQMGYRIVWR